jgi:dihydroorotate dehydrogenase subfamily 2
MGVLYKKFVRPILFRFNSELVHEWATNFGYVVGVLTRVGGRVWTLGVSKQGTDAKRQNSLSQTLHGVQFKNPVGLAAGFDYEGKLPYALPIIGFGFGTVGTITNKPYEGNPSPMLGRLISARALVVNKGFKNSGIDAIIKKFSRGHFAIPIGLSIGKTNSRTSSMTQDEAVADVVTAFTKAESARLPFTHYELNISCPNLYGNVEFYSPTHLHELLAAVTGLKLSKPIFIKMPITESNEQILAMLEVISKFPVQGVIFGNLRKDRNDPTIDQTESAKYLKGHIAGKPTEARANELIALAYRNFGQKLTVIGCGGVFSAEDAYKKIRLGASLVQLVSGLIYEGPFLPYEMNRGLRKLLARDGYNNTRDAIGKSA